MYIVNLLNPINQTNPAKSASVDLRQVANSSFKAKLNEAHKANKPINLIESQIFKSQDGTKIAANNVDGHEAKVNDPRIKKPSDPKSELLKEIFVAAIAQPDPLAENDLDGLDGNGIDNGFAKQQQMQELYRKGLENIKINHDN